MIKKLGIKKPVKVRSSVVTSGPYHNRPRDITGDDITEMTSEILYEESGIGPEEVDILELHDAFTIAELLYYECMGLCKKGDGLKFLRLSAPGAGCCPMAIPSVLPVQPRSHPMSNSSEENAMAIRWSPFLEWP
jgi:hypothetical protein